MSLSSEVSKSNVVLLLDRSGTRLTSIFTFSVMVTILLQMVILYKRGKWSKVRGGGRYHAFDNVKWVLHYCHPSKLVPLYFNCKNNPSKYAST